MKNKPICYVPGREILVVFGGGPFNILPPNQ